MKEKVKRKFALVEKEILYSKAWAKLKHSERVIYLHLKGQFTGMNGDRLQLPYLKYMKEIMSRDTFYNGIKKLDEIGFIDCVSNGQKTRFINGNIKTPINIYKLSGRWRIFGLDHAENYQKKINHIQGDLFDDYCARQEDETEP